MENMGESEEEEMPKGDSESEYCRDYRRDYLVRTLSRTTRKDYENYVINAIWNRLAMSDVKPVTQQIVYHPDGHHSFIDMYFPQLNIGIECDEGYHDDEDQHKRDVRRELIIVDVLSQVKADTYEVEHVHAGRPYSMFEQEIDDAVTKLRYKVEQLKAAGAFVPWNATEWRTYFAGRDTITVTDDIGFPRIVDAVNTLCDDRKAGYQSAFFIPSGFREPYGDTYHIWFPKLAVKGNAVTRGWNNQLSLDGQFIEEFNEDDPGVVDRVGPEGVPTDKRVVFAQMLNPATRVRDYRFVGVFQRIANGCGDSCRRYERISDSFPVIHRVRQ